MKQNTHTTPISVDKYYHVVRKEYSNYYDYTLHNSELHGILDGSFCIIIIRRAYALNNTVYVYTIKIKEITDVSHS